MTRRCYRACIGIAVALLLPSAVQLNAAWPNAIIIYGGSLDRPIFLGPDRIVKSTDVDFLYRGSTQRISADITGRPYFGVAMFWGGDVARLLDAEPAALLRLKPEQANQHARLYSPVGGESGLVIATPFIAGSPCRFDSDGENVQGLGFPRPIPTEPKGFPCGWRLGDAAVQTLRALGVPGF